jgi:hypothetical protein
VLFGSPGKTRFLGFRLEGVVPGAGQSIEPGEDQKKVQNGSFPNIRHSVQPLRIKRSRKNCNGGILPVQRAEPREMSPSPGFEPPPPSGTQRSAY